MSKPLLVTLAMVCAVSAGCGVFEGVGDDVTYDNGGTCPEPPNVNVQSGLYDLAFGQFEPPTPDFAASQASDVQVEVDRTAGEVTVMYEQDGKSVVATYKITGSEFL